MTSTMATQIAKLSAIASRLLDLAADVESGAFVGSHTLIKISQEITSAIGSQDCWAHLKGMTGNISPPVSPSACSCASKK